MSQAFFNATWKDQPVQVMAGWDGVESELYVKVFYLDELGEVDESAGLLLDTWKKVDPRPTEITDGAAALVMGIQDKLARLDIAIPQLMLGEILAHMVADDNHTRSIYDDAGNRRVLNGAS
ncbi:hypothetical protein [Burkholderia sp. Tr-20390]|uniref:hypothetical protein n=1 Tax=Burkholderia sp. Tr-20390 TaxID=2703904 RepID=UPI001981B537|nr:hypothetical protein [Burkholderia sp. Tr-20390]MBN3729448.1 hypothetical protein [Burkholderia sp. Tr-20390]